MELEEIQALIKFVAKSGATEVELETSDFKIIIKTPGKKRKGDQEETEATIVQAQMPMVPVVQSVTAIPQTIPSSEQEHETKEAQKEEGIPSSEESIDDSKYTTIKSPMIGTFYRSSAPDKPPFINVGDHIENGNVICIIEAMKLFNEIEAEVSGNLVKVLVDDATPVEYDQPLFLIEPS